MAHSDFKAALAQRLQEIDEQLKPVSQLIEERRYIMRILQLQEGRPIRNALVHQAGPPPFAPNPDSKASKILAAAREVLERQPGRETTFLKIYHAMPKEILGSGRHSREHVRGTLIRAGGRVGIAYVNSDRVRLVGAA